MCLGVAWCVSLRTWLHMACHSSCCGHTWVGQHTQSRWLLAEFHPTGTGASFAFHQQKLVHCLFSASDMSIRPMHWLFLALIMQSAQLHAGGQLDSACQSVSNMDTISAAAGYLWLMLPICKVL
jgi:hypothetical protein